MSTNITDVSEFTSPVPVPNDGEACNAASLIQFVQKLCNRTLFLKDAIPNGTWIGRRLFYAPGDGTVHVGPVQGVLIGGKLCSKATDTSVTLGTLANNSWYAVYATNDGSGGITFVIDNVNGPDSTLTWKYASGASVTTHRFVGYFRTNSSGVPLAFRAEDGLYTYRRSAIDTSSDPIRPLTGGNQTSWTDVSLANYISPAARLARVQLQVLGAGGVGRIRTKDDTTSYWELTGQDGTYNTVANFEIETNSSGAIQYQVASSGVLAIYVQGYKE